MNLRTLLLLCAVAAPPCLLAGEPPAEPSPTDLDPATSRAMRHAVQADRIRRAAAADPLSVPGTGLLSPAAADAWRAMVVRPSADGPAPATPAFTTEQLQDFFAGAMVLPGPFDGRGAVFAYWNPWWDALLFVRTANGNLSSADVPAVQSFVWTSGETFRGESESGMSTVAPSATPLSVALWRAQSATRACFRERIGEGAGRAVRLHRSVTDADPAAEWQRIQTRAGLRLRLASLLVGNPTNAAVAARCCALLRSGGKRELARHFDVREDRFFCRTLAALPAAVRAGFVPYGCIPAPEGTLYLFVNEEMPRLYATVSFPKGRLDGPFAGAVQMEWYDLGEADALLAALGSDDAGKEVAP